MTLSLEQLSSLEEESFGSARFDVSEDPILGIDANDASHLQRPLTLFEDHKLDVAVAKELKTNLLASIIFPKRPQISVVVKKERRPRAKADVANKRPKISKR